MRKRSTIKKFFSVATVIFLFSLVCELIPINAMFSCTSDNTSTTDMVTQQLKKSKELLQMQPGEIELELTFLAKCIPEELNKIEPSLMIDTYIPDHGHAKLRLRKKAASFEITKKIPLSEDFSVHKEMSIPLTKEEYDVLSSTSKRKIVKHRYNITIDGYPAEVDVFLGDLLGLVLIDFEFSSEIEKRAFKMPAVCLADVTKEKFIAGGILAGKSYGDIKNDLDTYNYTPLFL